MKHIAEATELANLYGYDEINFKCVALLYLLNCPVNYYICDLFDLILFMISCGCPSPRVAGHGCFGVRLMLDPKVGLEV